jgi:hypothetical protein
VTRTFQPQSHQLPEGLSTHTLLPVALRGPKVRRHKREKQTVSILLFNASFSTRIMCSFQHQITKVNASHTCFWRKVRDHGLGISRSCKGFPSLPRTPTLSAEQGSASRLLSRRILRLQRHGMSQLGSRSEPGRWNAKANFNEASRIINIGSCNPPW